MTLCGRTGVPERERFVAATTRMSVVAARLASITATQAVCSLVTLLAMSAVAARKAHVAGGTPVFCVSVAVGAARTPLLAAGSTAVPDTAFLYVRSTRIAARAITALRTVAVTRRRMFAATRAADTAATGGAISARTNRKEETVL